MAVNLIKIDDVVDREGHMDCDVTLTMTVNLVKTDDMINMKNIWIVDVLSSLHLIMTCGNKKSNNLD